MAYVRKATRELLARQQQQRRDERAKHAQQLVQRLAQVGRKQAPASL